VAPTCVLDREQIPGDWLEDLALVYVNTARSGHLVKELARFGVPVISHIHELGHEFARAGAASVTGLLNHTTHFIACSETVAGFLRGTCQVSDDRVSVIHEMIPVGSVCERAEEMSPQAVRDHLNVPREAVLIGAVGVVSWRKGTDLFLQLADRFRRAGLDASGLDYRFVWIGDVEGSERFEEYAHDQEKLGLRDWLLFAGEQENPYPFVRALDIFCLPSREDPFPLVMLEAGALGKATVAFEGSGGAEEFCAMGGGVTVPYLDMDAMAQELARQSSRSYREERERAGVEAKALVEGNFGVEMVAPKIMEIVDRYMGKGYPDRDLIEQVMVTAQAAKRLSARSRSQITGRIFSKWGGVAKACCEREYLVDHQGLVELTVPIVVPASAASKFRLRIELSDRPAIARLTELRLLDSEGNGELSDFLDSDVRQFTYSDSMIELESDEEGVTVFAMGLDSRIYTPNIDIRGLPNRFEVRLTFRLDCELAQGLRPFVDASSEERVKGQQSFWRRALGTFLG
jgi:hypothetical protein